MNSICACFSPLIESDHPYCPFAPKCSLTYRPSPKTLMPGAHRILWALTQGVEVTTESERSRKRRNDADRRERARGRRLSGYISQQAADALRRLMAKHGTKTAAIEAALIGMDQEAP